MYGWDVIEAQKDRNTRRLIFILILFFPLSLSSPIPLFFENHIPGRQRSFWVYIYATEALGFLLLGWSHAGIYEPQCIDASKTANKKCGLNRPASSQCRAPTRSNACCRSAAEQRRIA